MARPFTILYAEDDRDDQLVFLEVLKETRPDIKCEIAFDGRQVFQLLERMEKPDCIYLDINMPIINGLETLAKLKSDKRFCDIPVFVLTTSPNPITEIEARQLGAWDFFRKPSTYSEYIKLLMYCFKLLKNE